MSNSTVPIRPIKKGSTLRLGLALGALALAAGGLAYWGTSKPVAMSKGGDAFLAWNTGQSGIVTTKTGLQYQVLKPGEGTEKPDGPSYLADVTFEGKLLDGTLFQPKAPGQQEIGSYIPGFTEALQLMPKGSTYRVWLPPKLGYGASPPPGSKIPANSVLVFDIEMRDFISPEQLQQLMQQRQMMEQMQQGQQRGAGAPGQGRPGGR